MGALLANGLLLLSACALGASCAAQSDEIDVPQQTMPEVQFALDELARLARARAPRDQLADVIVTLRGAYELRGIVPVVSRVESATAPPPQSPPPSTSAGQRPSPAELDRRQREMADRLNAGPSLALKGWQKKMRAGLDDVAAQVDAASLDYAGVQAAVTRLQETLAQRPPPDSS